MRIIAEAGPCNGDVNYACDAVAMAHAAGAWAIKVQMYQADKIVQPWAKRYDHTYGSSGTQHEAFQNTIDYPDWRGVKDYADTLGIEFFASCFDLEAVDWCESMGVEHYKIASGEITNYELLEYVGNTRKHVILSTGASTLSEIEAAKVALGMYPDEVTIMACSLEYPASMGLMNRILQLRTAFPGYPIGYSDHTPGTDSTWVAASMGATMLEKHFTLTPGEGGDHDFAVTPTELYEMVSIARRAEELMEAPLLFGPTAAEQAARKGARRGVYYARDLTKGQPFTREDVKILRPQFAEVTPEMAAPLYGGTMLKDVKAGMEFVPGDVEF